MGVCIAVLGMARRAIYRSGMLVISKVGILIRRVRNINSLYLQMARACDSLIGICLFK